MKIKVLESTVKEILEKDPSTRSDDFILVTSVYQRLGKINDTQTFYCVMLSHIQLGLPSFKSITRARRKVQEKYPALRANKQMQDKREEQEQMFFEYGIGG